MPPKPKRSVLSGARNAVPPESVTRVPLPNASAEFGVPGELVAEGFVIHAAQREPRGDHADLELVLHERLRHARVFVEHRAEGLRARVFVAVLQCRR